jgi:F0F1-type ATP synthase assembly protein I
MNQRQAERAGARRTTPRNVGRLDPLQARHRPDVEPEDEFAVRKVATASIAAAVAGAVIGAMIGLAIAALVDTHPMVLGLGTLSGALAGLTATGLVAGRLAAHGETKKEEHWPDETA